LQHESSLLLLSRDEFFEEETLLRNFPRGFGGNDFRLFIAQGE